MAFPFPPSLQALDANGGVINSRQFHPLFGVIVGGPGGTIDADVPNVSLRSLSANNFHWSTYPKKRMEPEFIQSFPLHAASDHAHRLSHKSKRKDRRQTTRGNLPIN